MMHICAECKCEVEGRCSYPIRCKECRWLSKLYFNTEQSKSDKRALNEIYSKIDNMMNNGAWQSLNLLLSKIDLTRINEALIVGLLTATLPARSKIEYRVKFMSKARRQLIKSKGYTEEDLEELLNGL